MTEKLRPRRLLTPKLPQSKIHHKPPIEMCECRRSLFGQRPSIRAAAYFCRRASCTSTAVGSSLSFASLTTTKSNILRPPLKRPHHLPCAGRVGYDVVLVCDNLTHFDARRVEISMNDRLTCEEALPSSPIHRQHIPHRGVGSDPCWDCTSHSQTQAACSWAGPLGCRWAADNIVREGQSKMQAGRTRSRLTM